MTLKGTKVDFFHLLQSAFWISIHSFIHSFIHSTDNRTFLAVLKTEGFFWEGEDWGLDFSGKVIAIHIQEKIKERIICANPPPPAPPKKKSRKKERPLQLDDWVTVLCR
jgi:hypothetical protein